MMTVLNGLVLGIIFGIAFEKSKVFEAASILGQLLFKRFIMLKVLMTAMLTSMLVLAALKYGGMFEYTLKDLNIYTNIIGGGLLGAGIALAGACPGTVFAQVGVGYKDALFTLAGGLVAALIYSVYNCQISTFFHQYSLGKLGLAELTGMGEGALIGGISVLFILCLVMIERLRPWRTELEQLKTWND